MSPDLKSEDTKRLEKLKVGDADHQNYYFDSYASSEIHETMLKVSLHAIKGP